MLPFEKIQEEFLASITDVIFQLVVSVFISIGDIHISELLVLVLSFKML